jgi:hypothetical protein
MSGVHFEEDTPKGSGVVGSDEEMYMDLQGEEDKEEVDSRDLNQGVEKRVTFPPQTSIVSFS